MPYRESLPEEDEPGEIDTPIYNNLTIINKSNGLYNFDSEDYSAFEKWNNLIVSLPSKHIIYGTKMIININIGPMEANTLGYTQIDDYYYDEGSTIPYIIKEATIVFNKTLVSSLKSQLRNGGKSTFYYMLLHEMGHALGIGALFNVNNLQFISGGTHWYSGVNGNEQYKSYFPQYPELTNCGIENEGGSGTAGVHIEEGVEGSSSSNNRYLNGVFHPVLDHELMTGWSDSIGWPLPLSRITLGLMIDLGYTMADYSNADYYDPLNSNTLG